MLHRFQFSLTWLAIASLVIGAFFGGVATGRRCHEIENEQARTAISHGQELLADEKRLLAEEREALYEELRKRIAEWASETEALRNASLTATQE